MPKSSLSDLYDKCVCVWRCRYFPEIGQQGDCILVCCWIYAALYYISALRFIKGEKLVSLSKQSIIDCYESAKKEVEAVLLSPNSNKRCCYSGACVEVFSYAMEHGVLPERHYRKFSIVTMECKKSTLRNHARELVKISDFGSLTDDDDDNNSYRRTNVGKLMDLLDAQPVTAAIFHYSSLTTHNDTDEVYKPTSAEVKLQKRVEAAKEPTIYHSIIIIGYGYDERGELYWLIRNSWGKDWGNSGIGRISSTIPLFNLDYPKL